MAAAIAAGEAVSWVGARQLAGSLDEREVLDQLEAIEKLSRYATAGLGVSSTATTSGSALLSLVLGLAVAQLLAALGWFAWNWPMRTLPSLIQATIALTFFIAAVMLWVAGDQRARKLAAAYTFAASAFVTALLVSASGTAPIAALASGPYFECFIPLALWRFARAFPQSRRFTRIDRFAAGMAAMSAWVGAVLFLWTFIAPRLPGVPDSGVGALLWGFRREGVAAPFWNAVFLLTAPALLASVWQAQSSTSEERRRALWFLAAIGAGLLPVLAIGLLRYIVSVPSEVARGAVLLGSLSIPFTTSYVVLVHRVLPLRTVLRRTARYAVARGTLTALLFALPFAVGVNAYVNRDRPLADMVEEVGTLGWLVTALWASALSAVLLLRRHMERLLGVSQAGGATVADAAEAIGRARTAREASFEAARQVEGRLSTTNVAVLIWGHNQVPQPMAGAVAPLPDASALIGMLAESPTIRVSQDSPLYRLLPRPDQEWLASGRFELLARVPSAGRSVAGLIAAGGIPQGVLSRAAEEEHLAAIASTLGLVLASTLTAEHPSVAAVEGAVECERCGAVAATACGCGAPSRPSRVPVMLSGKFAVERRIGQGGMGVVYSGRDVHLNRPVALKTLPQISESSIDRLFAEAQTMAVVEHPHLALIYGLEIWQRTPILVVEYLPGGTLSERLKQGPQSIAGALAIGIALTKAVAALHAAGILHRDIKPSNVGFTRNGSPKLLDFGVARFRDSSELTQTKSRAADDRGSANTAVAGTPLYLPPEALAGAGPDRYVDLWGVAVVTLEAMLGTHPYARRSALDAIRGDGQAVTRRQLARLAPELRAFFENALATDQSRRPTSADTMSAELQQLGEQFVNPHEFIR